MSTVAEKQGILLESGTNEIELIEFYLGSQSFGINVHKLREIIPYDEAKTTILPESQPSVVGTFLVRGNTIPLIDLNIHLRRDASGAEPTAGRRVVLVCEFNRCVNGFLVDGVNQIHRISWKNIQPLSTFIGRYKPRFTGSFAIDGREILIVDLEHIVAELDPEAGLSYHAPETVPVSAPTGLSLEERRGQCRLFMAEDSTIIRDSILRILHASGYTQVCAFVDGEACYDEILARKKNLKKGVADQEQLFDLLISDIEMPKLDGLTLCRRIKEDPLLSHIPVIMFSSLITEQMVTHCQQVGADGYISKPQISELVAMVDDFLLK
ncbi:chemotaxis protein CheW [Trichloromonas sp.]|uniref:chemotaxis protein CheW n=1 Tax=Trichloromonas sp. TaxID=3069249 RepID=UPI002A41E31C|nr:chemotaxis protein [Trichloromonas sp.]